jgi:hypothetical protein
MYCESEGVSAQRRFLGVRLCLPLWGVTSKITAIIWVFLSRFAAIRCQQVGKYFAH